MVSNSKKHHGDRKKNKESMGGSFHAFVLHGILDACYGRGGRGVLFFGCEELRHVAHATAVGWMCTFFGLQGSSLEELYYLAHAMVGWMCTLFWLKDSSLEGLYHLAHATVGWICTFFWLQGSSLEGLYHLAHATVGRMCTFLWLQGSSLEELYHLANPTVEAVEVYLFLAARLLT